MTSANLHIDPDPSHEYPADLYRSSQLARYAESIADLTDADLERFHSDGYLAVKNLLDAEDVRDVLAGLGHAPGPRRASTRYLRTRRQERHLLTVRAACLTSPKTQHAKPQRT